MSKKNSVGSENPKDKDPANTTENTIEKYTRHIKNGTYIMAAFTALMFVANFFLTCLTYSLYDLTRKDSNSSSIRDSITNNRAQKALDLAFQQFDSAQANSNRSLAISDSALLNSREYTRIYKSATETENRAYITIRINRYLLDTIHKKFTIIADLVNIGKTPAYNLKKWANYKVGDEPTQQELISHEDNNMIPITVGNGTAIGFYYNDIKLVHDTFNIVKLINAKAINIYVFGCVIYVDAFNKEHFTHYLVRYDVDRKSIVSCNKYNDCN